MMKKGGDTMGTTGARPDRNSDMPHMRNGDRPYDRAWSDDQSESNGHHGSDAARLARALGWFSLGLGLAQILAPRQVVDLAGIDPERDTHGLMRALGAREIASGIGILTRAKPAPWLFARVGGDALDLALLTSARNAPRANRNRVAAATAAVIGVTAADALVGAKLAGEAEALGEEHPIPQDIRVTAAITVGAPIDQVYQAWDGFRNLPRFMGTFATVEVVDDRRSHWKASLPAGMSLAWDVEITETQPNERIAWSTSDSSALTASGQVRFRAAPRDQGTEVLFDAHFSPPGGELGRKIGGLFADAIGVKIQGDLRRFKQLIELGEIVQSDDSIVPGPNAAQPRPSPSPTQATYSATTAA